MKKLIALLSSIIIISECSTITDQTTTSIQTTEQLQSYSVEDKQAQNEIENNKSNLNFKVVIGIGPMYVAYETTVLPLNYTT